MGDAYEDDAHWNEEEARNKADSVKIPDADWYKFAEGRERYPESAVRVEPDDCDGVSGELPAAYATIRELAGLMLQVVFATEGVEIEQETCEVLFAESLKDQDAEAGVPAEFLPSLRAAFGIRQ